MARYTVTKTWDDRPWDGVMRLPMHETFEVDDLVQAGPGIEWKFTGHGTYSGNNDGFGPKLVTYIARPISQ
jgi:hypothetical protein